MTHWKIAALALFGLFASWGTAQADGKSNCAKPTVTVYEISGNGVSGTAEAVQTLKTAIEKREAFAESDCELKHLD